MITTQYLAGFFDGEGFIGVSYWKSNKNKKIFEHYYISCEISQISLDVLKQIQIKYGGTIMTHNKSMKKNTHKSFRIRWQNKKCIELLKILEPFLIVKKQEAKIAITFPFTQNSSKSRQEIRTKLMSLKLTNNFDN